MRCEIAVVGGGPVGAAAALALHDRGFDVALVERGAPPAAWRPEAYDLRVYALSPASRQLLAGLQVWDAIAEARVSPYSNMRIWEREPASALEFRAADAACGELGWIVEHGLVTSALWSRLSAIPVHAQCEIDSAAFDASGAVLRLRGGRELRAQLVVAADGAESQMRALAGIETIRWRYGQRAIVCHVRTEKPHARTAWQRFLKTGPLAFLPLADGRCSIVWSADEAQAAELLALDDAAFLDRLASAAEHALGTIFETTPRIAVPLQLLHAQEYCVPGLVLAGDAAHAVHPLAGQGVNLGFDDVRALAETLAAARDARRDWAGVRTLSRYARARKADNLEMLALTDALYRAFRPSLPGMRALLGMGLSVVDRSPPARRWLARRATRAR